MSGAALRRTPKNLSAFFTLPRHAMILPLIRAARRFFSQWRDRTGATGISHSDGVPPLKDAWRSTTFRVTTKRCCRNRTFKFLPATCVRVSAWSATSKRKSAKLLIESKNVRRRLNALDSKVDLRLAPVMRQVHIEREE